MTDRTAIANLPILSVSMDPQGGRHWRTANTLVRALQFFWEAIDGDHPIAELLDASGTVIAERSPLSGSWWTDEVSECQRTHVPELGAWLTTIELVSIEMEVHRDLLR